MAKREEPTLLQIGPWLTALGADRARVIEEAGITESYLSQLISGRKVNPSQQVLKAIAGALGITVPMLYQKPPDANAIEVARMLERARKAK